MQRTGQIFLILWKRMKNLIVTMIVPIWWSNTRIIGSNFPRTQLKELMWWVPMIKKWFLYLLLFSNPWLACCDLVVGYFKVLCGTGFCKSTWVHCCRWHLRNVKTSRLFSRLLARFPGRLGKWIRLACRPSVTFDLHNGFYFSFPALPLLATKHSRSTLHSYRTHTELLYGRHEKIQPLIVENNKWH